MGESSKLGFDDENGDTIKRMLSAAINKLTPGVRTAIELRELGELSTGEIARLMGLSVEAVKGRLFHGRKKLRKTLKCYVESAWA